MLKRAVPGSTVERRAPSPDWSGPDGADSPLAGAGAGAGAAPRGFPSPPGGEPGTVVFVLAGSTWSRWDPKKT